jgi:hypothetical protein
MPYRRPAQLLDCRLCRSSSARLACLYVDAYPASALTDPSLPDPTTTPTQPCAPHVGELDANDLKTNGDGFLQFDLKTGGDGFSRFGLKISGGFLG